MVRCRQSSPLWIPLLVSFLTWLNRASAVQEATLDPGTIQMLSNILESLDSFRNDRLRDLERIRLAAPPPGNASSNANASDVSYRPANESAVSEHIRALKEGILGHNPVKKTFGYKVTVYTSPIEEDGKGGKPVLVTQYVGGDMKPDPPPEKRSDDLDQSANDPRRHVIHSSASALLPVSVSLGGSEADKAHQSRVSGGELDHHRKTEHSEASEKGHQKGHSASTRLAKGHDHEKHSNKHDEHHKETDKEEHRHDTHAHDKGGASQQGIKERTEIEYYEREHFLDTEYDKAKSGHEKTSGVKEHEKHNDHDSHEDKKLHVKEDSRDHRAGGAAAHSVSNAGESSGIRPSHYSPPYGIHYKSQPHVAHEEHAHQAEDSKRHLEESAANKLHHSEESKGHRENNHEKDHQSDHGDKGYLDKDKGRRKEGYRERGYKITAEREYFLNDAHHDKGSGSHKSGSRSKDKEGAAHGSKEGERDRAFVKEEKKEEAHDAAYDSKDHKYFDGEAHKEGFANEEVDTKLKEGKEHHHEKGLPLAPPSVNYLEELPPPIIPIHHHHLAYAPSNDGGTVAYAANPLPSPKNAANSRQIPATKHQTDFDDDHDEEVDPASGYVGHSTYRKRDQSPLVTDIRDNVRRDVHAKPPTYAKTTGDGNAEDEEENSVRFPEKGKEALRNSEAGDNGEQFRTNNGDSKNQPSSYPKSKSYSEVPYHRVPDDDSSEKTPPKRYQETLPPHNKRKPYFPPENVQKSHRDPPVNTGNHKTGILIKNTSRYPKPEERPSTKTLPQDRRNPYPQLELSPNRKPGTAYGNPKQSRVPSDVYQQKNRHSQPYPVIPQDGGDQITYEDIQRYFPDEAEAYAPLVLRLQQEAYRQQQLPRIPTPLEQLRQHQQQNQQSYSPVVLTARGHPNRGQNQAVDVWYTRQRK